MCEPVSAYHEHPPQRLAGLLKTISHVRGSPIATFGASDLLVRDAHGAHRRIMQADQTVYLRPSATRDRRDHQSSWEFPYRGYLHTTHQFTLTRRAISGTDRDMLPKPHGEAPQQPDSWRYSHWPLGNQQIDSTFVSQSRIIDQVFQVDNLTTWTPESLLRYLSALPGRDLDPDLLQQCMLHEYFYAGISFIDRGRYERCSGPAVDLAKASFDREVDGYIQDIEDRFGRSISDSFPTFPISIGFFC